MNIILALLIVIIVTAIPVAIVLGVMELINRARGEVSEDEPEGLSDL